MRTQQSLLLVAALACLLCAAPALAAEPGLRAAGPGPGLPAAAPAAPDAPSAAGDGPQRLVARASVSCAQDLVYDDGEADQAIRLLAGDQGIEADAVMRFDTGIQNAVIEQLCICWNRDGGAVDDFDHDLVFYDVAPNGRPGNPIAVIPATANNVPNIGSGNAQTVFFDYDLSGLDIRSNGARLYAGVRWDGGPEGGPGLLLCIDQDGPGNQPIFFSGDEGGNWVASDDIFDPDDPQSLDPPTALMVRMSATDELPTCPQVPCVADDTTLCLNNDRFAVSADWAATNQGTSGQAQAIPLTGREDTGLFWFFNDNNVEVVVKVLNACGVNDRYWVFAGGLTNVQVELRVCDTREGQLRTYFNPANTAFQPIQDTNAFATCP